MKIHFIILLSLLTTAKAQNLTLAQLSTYARSQWKTNDSLRKSVAALQARLDGKDIRDSWRNDRIDSLMKATDSLKQILATTYYQLNQKDFLIDSINRNISIRQRRDTVIIQH